MGDRTGIEWTDATVNFWWGCTKVGPGCDHCYAEAWDRRFGGGHWGQGQPRRKIKSARSTLHRLDNQYADWSAMHECHAGNARAFGLPDPGTCGRRRVFIQSMSDLFDNEAPLDWFEEAWSTIEACNRLYIQILTKRIGMVEKRLAAIGRTNWPAHAGLMITVVNQAEADRDIPRLLDLKGRLGVPWVGLSCEPLMGPVDLTNVAAYGGRADALRGDGHASTGLDWAIAGGESGPDARPAHPDWFRELEAQCAATGAAFHFKQWGEFLVGEFVERDEVRFQDGTAFGAYSDGHDMVLSEAMDHRGEPKRIWREFWADGRGNLAKRVGKKAAGRLLDGAEHNAMPPAFRR